MPAERHSEGHDEISFAQAAAPIVFLLLLVTHGLVLRPLVFDQPPFPLEVIFILATAFAVTELTWLGYPWRQLERAIAAKLGAALPAFFILFAIGMVIGSWMISGTIPMLVYYGLQLIEPSLIYLFAFLVPVVFSLLTGTSWGSVGAVGIVLIGISQALGAHLGITAGAIIGGAYFGDKMSPLSDTTNLAALATEIDLYRHIRSMAYTTVPSALLAALIYGVLGWVYPPAAVGELGNQAEVLAALKAVFDFHLVLLLPPAIVLYGSLTRRPTLPVLCASTFCAAVLALVVQPFGLTEVLAAVRDGFRLDMAPWVASSGVPIPTEVVVLLERGGLYALIEAIMVAFTVFFFIGALEPVRAMPRVIGRLFGGIRSRTGTILAALAATATTSALASNQYATTFIVGDALRSRFDEQKIPRPVLSRSLEDAGTMFESLVPWSPSAVFMVTTLGVAYVDYAPWQLLSLINLVVAPLWAILGIGIRPFEGEDAAGVAVRDDGETDR